MDIKQIRQQKPEWNDLDDQQVVSVLKKVYYPEMSESDISSAIGAKQPEAPPAERTALGTAGDLGLTAVKSLISVPELAVGLMDIPTMGMAGKAAEAIGFRPKEAKAFLDENYSDAQKQANQAVQRAQGFKDIFAAAVSHPSVIAHSALESIPTMFAGGLFGRASLAGARALGLAARPATTAAGALTEAGAATASRQAAVAAAAGEGIAGAGSAAEQIRQETEDGRLTGGQVGAALASGAGTAAFGLLGGKVARALGIHDVDTMIVQAGKSQAVSKGVVRRVLEGAASEGLLEELPQSIHEQVMQNLALGKPLDEGVDQAAVLGLLTGAAMGAGANVLGGAHKAEGTTPPGDPGAAPGGPPLPSVPPALPAPTISVGADQQAMTADQRQQARDAIDARAGQIVERGPLARANSMALLAGSVEDATVKPGPLAGAIAPATADPIASDAPAVVEPDAWHPIEHEYEDLTDDDRLMLDDYYRHLDEIGSDELLADNIPDFGAASNVSEEEFLRSLGASEQEIKDALSTSNRPSGTSQSVAINSEIASNDARSAGERVEAQPTAKTATNSVAGKEQAGGVVAGDITHENGSPFTIKFAARNAAKKAGDGHEVVKVAGGFVVRKASDGTATDLQRGTGDGDRSGRTDAAAGVGADVGRDGSPIGADTAGKPAPVDANAPGDGAAPGAEAVAPAPAAAPGAPKKTASKTDLEHLFGIDRKRKAALDRVNGPKGAFFMSEDKAKDFVKNGHIGETHEVVQEGKAFHIRAKGQANTAPAAPSEKISEAIQPTPATRGQAEAAPASEKIPADAQKRPQPGEPGYTLLDARNDLIDFRTQVANEGAVGDDRAQERVRRQEKLVKEMEAAEPDKAKADSQAAGAETAPPTPAKTVNVPQTVDAAMTADMEKQQSRVKRLRTAATADGMTLDEKKAAQLKVTAAEATLRAMRTKRFDAEDAAVKAVADKDAAAFSDHGDIFPSAAEALKALIPASESAGQAPAPATDAYGAKNTLVSQSRADELRAKLREKAKNHVFGGLDTEMMAWGTELAVFHLEAGLRKFADLAKAMAADLGVTPDRIKPYLRSWYNGARDMMEDHGHSIRGMDSPETVRAELEKIGKEPVAAEPPADNRAESKEQVNAARPLDRAGPGALERAPAEDVRPPGKGGDAGQDVGRSRRGDEQGNARPDDAGGDVAGGVGAGEGTPPVSARGTPANAKGAKKRGVQNASGTDAGAGGLRPQRQGLTPEAGANPAPNAPVIRAPQVTDFTIEDDLALGEGGQKTKFKQNVEAIRLAKAFEADPNRWATPDEQRALARYVGWGGLAQAFDPNNSDWAREHVELKELLTPEEYADAARSTRYAHYTSRQVIVDGIYAALRQFGFAGGKVLEAGAGVGNFLGLMPADMRTASRFTAVERDRLSSTIARQLYPQQNVQRADFTAFKGTDAYFDAAVGNPPFASDTQTDTSGRKHLSGLSLHNYFFAKAVDMLREGGVLAQVVTNSFLDAKTDSARRYIADRTVFLGAIRLPNNAFSKNAGTEVTTDIIFLQKRPDSEIGSRAAKEDARRWLGIGTHTDAKGQAVPLNQYFIDNPHMMLGDFGAYGTMYRGDMPALVSREGQDTASMLREAVAKLPKSIYRSVAETTGESQHQAAITALRNPTVQEGGYFVAEDGKLMQRLPDLGGEARGREISPSTQWSEKKTLGDAGFARIKALSEMRGTLRGLIAAEMADDDKGMGQLRATLNEQYDAYRKEHGLINDPSTLRVFDDDPDYPLLASLEHGYTPGIGPAAAKRQGIKPTKSTAKKGPIFDRRVVAARKAVRRVDSPADALAVSMAERGKLDPAYIGQLLGRDPEETLRELASGEKPAIFRDPATDEYVLRDAYLSGNVRAKLEQARAAGVMANIRALEEVQPEDVGAGHISARIGSPWVPTNVYEDFASHLFGEGTEASVRYIPLNSTFQISVKPGNDVAFTSTYGTAAVDGEKLIAAMLNNRPIKVTYKDSEGKTHTNVEATEQANNKAQEIRDKFNDWLFSDSDRSDVLVRSYNDTNNNYVTRVYDGSRMDFPGKVPDEIIKFRRHQRNAIARTVQDRTALYDHVVGAGKTFTVVASAMELKRTGLAKKPMVAVPNHLVKQWAADFYRLYPGANILTATKKDFERSNRRKFLAKIATGDWDAVVIAHSSFGFIKPAPEFEAQFNQKEIDKIVKTIDQVKQDSGDKQQKSRTVKQLEGLKERLENRIKSLRDKPMDDLLDFEQIGVDQLFVDEFHLFKNLMFSTKMQNVQGLGDSKGSQRAYDMLVKINQIFAKNGRDQGFVAATGTPVSNSLAEMYHMMRYLMPTQMRELGFESFDAWANTYASVEQVWMQKPSGDGFKASARMANFVNTPELLKMFDQVCDTVTMDDIKAAYAEENDGKEFPLPKLKGDRRTPVSLDKTPAQEAYMTELAKRAEAVEKRKGPPVKGEDNVLVIMGDGRKAAMDMRLVNFAAVEREPGSRVDRASDEIVARYKQFAQVKGTQLVFSDLGTPVKHAKTELKEYEALRNRVASANEDIQASATLGNEAAQAIVEDAEEAQAELDAKGPDWLDSVRAAERGFSVYDDLRSALIEKGIPPGEIAFIHDFNTDDQKAALFRKVNAGEIRVLMGSTPKMGAGTNVQERLTALHHLDVPWKPSDVEQREGRIIRQGNALAHGPSALPGFEAEILAYVTKDTLDMRMWQVQETKLRMINQLRTRNVGREVDNAFEDLELSAGEMQAAATGNIDLLHEIQLRTEVKKLEQRKRAFDASRNELESRRRRAAEALQRLPDQIARNEPLAEQVKQYQQEAQARLEDFNATIDGKEYTNWRDAQAYLHDIDERKVKTTDKEGNEVERAAPIDVTINGEQYTARAAMADAFAELRGDVDPIVWDVNGQEYRRRARIQTAIRQQVVDAIADQTEKPLGEIGGFEVKAEGNIARDGSNQLEVTLSKDGKVVASRADSVKDSGQAPAQAVRWVDAMLNSMVSEKSYLQRVLDRAKKEQSDLEKTETSGEWPDTQKLEDARAKHKEVLNRLAGKGETQAAKPDEPMFNRVNGNRSGMDAGKVQQHVDSLTRRWANSPTIEVVSSMDDPKVPERVRAHNEGQKAQGAEGEPEGFFYQGKVYIVANQMRSADDVARVVFHETLGHYGLRGVFGDGLTRILTMIAGVRRGQVTAKAKQYGLDSNNQAHRLIAAEEVLAEMAQTTPGLGFVRRAIAAIRAWMRQNVPGFQGLRVSDAEIIRSYILPARAFVERGAGVRAGREAMFSRSAEAGNQPGSRTIVPVSLKLEGWAGSTSELSAMAREVYTRELQGSTIHNASLGADIAFTAEGEGEAFGARGKLRTPHRAELVRVLRDLVGRAVKVGESEASKGREADSKAFHTLVAPLQVNGSMHAVRVTVREALRVPEGQTPHKFYDITSVQIGRSLGVHGLNGTEFSASHPAPAEASGVSVAALAKAINPNHEGGDTPMFSRAATADEAGLNNPRDFREKAQNAVNDLFRTPGVVSWWHKTVGTMHDLAERSPSFKRVYDSVQSFLQDVSYYATEAADLAPRILPKLDSLRDLKKSALSAEDTKALSRPVFEGTLIWSRDQDGRLVKLEELEQRYDKVPTEEKAQMLLRKRIITPEQLKRWQGSKVEIYEGAVNNRFEAEFLKGGVVFTDDELRKVFGANDQTISLYHEFRAATDQSLNRLGQAEMLRFGGKDVQALREMVMDAPSAYDAAEILRDHLLREADEQPTRRQVLIDTANKMVEKGDQIQRLIDQGYAPLSRFGSYTLDVVDANGERVYFGLFEGRLERGTMARRMRANFPDATITMGTNSEQSYKLFNGITPETLELFGEMVGLEEGGDEAQHQMFQQYLKLAKSNRSAMKRLIERKGIAGFSEDAGRVLAGFVYSNARLTSQNLHQGEITRATNEIPKSEGQLKDMAVKMTDYVRNPQEEAQAIRGMLFTQYLGGSVASAMVNMTQPLAVTMPYLSQWGGVRAAAGQMKAALRDVMRKTTGDAKLDAALKRAEAEGIVAPQEVHQLLAQARGQAALRSGDGTVAGNAKATASNALSKLALAWGKPFSLAEQFNRRVTFIAAYRTAVENNIPDPAKFAQKAIADTQFVYNKGNKPQWARGAVGSLVFTFKQYSISYAELLHRMATQGGPEGKRAAAFMLAMLFMMSGAGGLPFMSDAEDLLDGIAQRLGYSFSTKQARRQFLAKVLGEGAGGIVERGMSGIPGMPIDVAGRMGMGNLIPATGLLTKKEDYSRDVAEILGPSADLAQRAFQGGEKFLQGHPMQAAQMVAPRAAENLRKGVEMLIDGQYKDSKGRKVIDTDASEAFVKMLGFQPNDVAKVQEGTVATQIMVSHNRLAKKDFSDEMASAVYDKDYEKQQQVRESVREWNQRNPHSPITLDMAAIRRRVVAMRADKSKRVEQAAPKAIRSEVRKQLEESSP